MGEINWGRVGPRWADTLILVSTFDRGATLCDIIGGCDYMNHAILTYEELSGGLARLLAAKYMIERDGTFRPSAKGRRAQLVDGRPHMRKLARAAEAVLGRDPHPTPGSAITRAEYKDAVKQYRETF